ncbi:hypothetical protein K431DRAFT_289305 [Polychaeton citri CBS 116435]|uniref:Zn(2)-C6 fungal-type domain-containing protein n=1 Tax=Polychaeton citri CBS 116435 TaxID=1314669 RepID=A0A9P4PX62_9PEZI|nr:hypothetical protein K431DRAFT_289305 [Polychaeton citri CBS 116435]
MNTSDCELAVSRAPRRNVTTACEACRESKIKCDAVAPRCTTCVKKDRGCRYRGGRDKRRISFRPTLTVLHRHIETLTNALVAAGIPIPSLDEDGKSLVNNAFDAVGLSKLESGLVTNGGSGGRSSHITISHEQRRQDPSDEVGLEEVRVNVPAFGGATLPDQTSAADAIKVNMPDATCFTDWSNVSWEDAISPDWPWTGLLAADTGFGQGLGTFLPFAQDELVSSKIGGAPMAVDEENQREDEFELEIVNQVAARFGSLRIATDGKLRYFGTPANANLVGSDRAPRAQDVHARTTEKDNIQLLHISGLNQVIPSDLEDRLLNRFFAWHNLCHPVVDDSSFWAFRRDGMVGDEKSAQYTSTLVNAMCAIGASHEPKYSADMVTFPRALPDFFADRAKCLLETELDSPCVATVQALLLMSSYEVGVERIARSWLYSGMAMRLCFDLGLHLDAQPYVERGILSVAEAATRQKTFWSSYIINYRASFNLGRPFTLDKSEITVHRPCNASNISQDDMSLLPSLPSSGVDFHGVPDLVQSGGPLPLAAVIVEKRIELCDLVEPIARALYGNVNIPISSLLDISVTATDAMFQWRQQLDAVLQQFSEINAEPMPQALVLQLEYHYLQILVHRPWTSRRLQPTPMRARGYKHARTTCIESASSIARLLEVYEHSFGFRHLDVETLQVLPSAALILIFATISPQESTAEGESIPRYLSTVLRALDECGRYHSCARNHLESLLIVRRQWHSAFDQRKRKIRSPRPSRDADIMDSLYKRARG